MRFIKADSGKKQLLRGVALNIEPAAIAELQSKLMKSEINAIP